MKAWPEGVPNTLEYPEIPLFQILRDTAARVPQKTATIFFNKRMSYQELDALSDKMAVMLKEMGVEKGDRVALFLPNSPQFVIGHFGILKAGGVSVPFNPTYKGREVQRQLENCDARIMLALDIVYDPVHKVRKETPLEHVVLTSIVDYMPGGLRTFASLKKDIRPRSYPDTLRFKDLLNKALGEPPEVDIDPKEDVAVLLYTGGTTGTPKGVMLTHYNQVANAVQAGAFGYLGEDAVVMAVLPYFHTYGITICMHTPIHLGGSIVLLPKFGIKETLKAIQKYRPTHFPGVPTMYVALLSSPELQKYDLRSIKFCVSGAAPLPPEVARRWKEVTGAMIVEGYGLTETSPLTHANPMDDWGKVRFGSIGIPVPDTEVKVVDLETGAKELQQGEIGELLIRGPQVMKGYWNEDEETRQVLRDGWFYTGDIAKMDEDGYFSIVDRKKDMIIVGGINVYPRDIEDVLFEHEAVELAAVIGVPDEFHGETPKAFVVLTNDYKGKLTEKELLDYCIENLAKHKVPKYLEFKDELPTTLIGKVLRKELREAPTSE
ncbi:MAG: long-chain fatty acid--CoA ligase [Candidatus Thermoplasmatota archaeon]|nr:long-chain fatty acid--CoA ligase [Candidatus Thermoplasmatota archaeon]